MGVRVKFDASSHKVTDFGDTLVLGANVHDFVGLKPMEWKTGDQTTFSEWLRVGSSGTYRLLSPTGQEYSTQVPTSEQVPNTPVSGGGVIGGTDFATQGELDAHISDGSAAHAASAVSASSSTLVGTATDVQGVLEELDNGIADHLADASAAHAATAIAFTPAGDIASTTVQAAIEEVAAEAGGGGSVPITDPTDIAGCVLWMAADSLSLANDAPVSSWTDGANGYVATQTGTARPTFKTNVRNGKPAVHFDPGVTNQFVAFADGALDLFRGATAFTIVASFAGSGMVFSRSTDDPDVACVNTGCGTVYVNADGDADSLDASASASFLVPSPWLYLWGPSPSGGTSLFAQSRLNGYVGGAPNAALPDVAAATVRIGYDSDPDWGDVMTGNVFEIAIYSRRLTQVEQREVLEYLSTKYATI